jgi:sugar lactone lactonase YvrE
VDGSGNVYVADVENNQVVKETPSGSSYIQSLVVSSTVSNPFVPAGIAVDGSGNLYIADPNHGQILKETPSGSSYTQTTVISGLQHGITSIAADQSGDLYFTDQTDHTAVKEALVSGNYNQSLVGEGGPGIPTMVAVDRNGNVYIAGIQYSLVNGAYVSSGFAYAETLLDSQFFSLGQAILPTAIAVDANGDVYIADSNGVLEESPVYGNFGSASVGSTGTQTLSLAFTFDTAGTLGGKAVLTQGATGQDFADAGTGTCTASTVYTAGETCTMNVTFTPKFSGTRYGAAVLYNSAGNTIATGRLQGTGVGPQIAFQPGIQSILGSGISSPMSVAVDGNGNIYFTEVGGSTLYEMQAVNGVVPASPTIRTIGSGFGSNVFVAVDSSGNLYVADNMNNAVKEVLAVKGSIPASPAIVTLGSGFSYPAGIAVDGNGNVYVANTSDKTVREIVAVGGSIPSSPTIRIWGGGFSVPFGVAVDGNGNVYVADEGQGEVKEMLAVNGSIPASPTINKLGSSFEQPSGVAVDGNGNVYVADYGNNAVKELLAINGSVSTSPSINTLGSGFSRPGGVAVDSRGNVFVADYGNNRVVKLDVADPPSLTFAATAPGSISSDSPRTVTVVNAGNAPLVFPIPSAGSNPNISANFALNDSGSSACPLLSPSSSEPLTLVAGESCQLPVSFAPTALGTFSGALILTDNNLNAAAPGYITQSIVLSGIGTGSFTLSSSASSLIMNQGGSGTSTITVTGVNGFTGSVNLSAAGLPSGVTASFSPNPTTGTSVLTLTASSASSLVNAVAITITGTSGPLTETTTLLLTVSPANFTLSASPSSLILNQGLSITSTVTVTDQSGFTGSVTLAAANLPSGVTASFTANPTNGTSILTLTANSNAVPGVYPISIFGTSGTEVAYAPNVSLAVVQPSFTVSAAPASVAVIQGGTGISTITVTGQSGFTGSVTLAASGLPSGVTASFATNPTTGTSLLTLTASSIAPAGTTTVAIIGTSGTLAATATIALTVISSPPSLTFRASPAAISIEQGLSGISTMITTVSGSFDSNVLFSVSGQPSGVSVSGPEYIAAPGSGSSTMIVDVASTVATGTYPITVTATGEGITQTATVTLTVLQSSLPAAYFSGVDTILASGYGGPANVAVDKNGNVYIAEYDGGTIDEIVAVNGSISASSPIRTLTTCSCVSVAVDGDGNVYFIDYESIKEIVAVNGSIPTSPTIRTLAGAQLPEGVAVDISGNVYFTDYSSETVSEIVAVNGSIPASPTIKVLASGFGGAEEIAVDGSGNLYVAGFGGVQEIVAVNGSIPASPTIMAIPGGTSGNRGVAVDANGDVYFSDEEAVSEILAVNGSIPAAPAVIEVAGVNQGLSLEAVDGIAVDSHGNVFISNIGFEQVVEVSTAGGNLGQVNTGATSPTVALHFSFGAPVTLGSTSVFTQGATGLDFADAGSDTCIAGTAYNAGQSCTVNVTFTPAYAGTRNGAVVLNDNNGNVIATAYLQGSGAGPQINFLPNTQSMIPATNLASPSAVAVDGIGNVYIADSYNGQVLKETLSSSGYTQSVVGGGFIAPTGVAVDGSGNVYIVDTYGNQVVKETPSGANYIESTVAPNGSSLLGPNGVAVDGSGNVYITDSENNRVLKETLFAGSYSESVIGNGLTDPLGVAVDGNGNVYIADTINNRVLLETLSAGNYTQSIISSNLNMPFGVTVDANNSVYIADYANNRVLKETPSVTGYSESIISGLRLPVGTAVDGGGNVFVAEEYYNDVWKLDFADAPSLSFASTSVGLTSPDSPQTVTIENVGNAALTFPILSTGNNPNISSNFALNSSGASACPLVSAGSTAAGSLAAGASCQLPISFTPAVAGALTGSLTLTDSNLNAATPGYATQTITLSGTGTQGTPAVSWTAPAAITYGTALSAAQLNATSTVAGTFTYSPAAGTVLTAGTQTLTVTFTPTDTTDYATATATVMLTVNQATPIITWANPADFSSGTPLTATQLDASANVPGVFAYSPAAGTVLSSGTQTLTATFTPTDTTDYTSATATATLAVD